MFFVHVVIGLLIILVELFIGYVICLLFPIPALNRMILGAWQRISGTLPPPES